MEYGLQLYSLRDVTKNSLEDGIRIAAGAGYKFVEYAGFFGNPAEKVAEWQEKYGVSCSGTHSPLDDLVPEKLEEVIRYHSIIGNRNYIMPGADLSTPEKLLRFCRIVNAAQPVLAEAGISVGYHNHSHEFRLMPWGSTIHSEIELRTKLDFELDTFWAFNAGADPIMTLERLGDRVKIIHLKDGFRGGKGTALGEGEAPVEAVRRYCIDHGLLMVVESEGLDPTGPLEVGRCIEYLRGLDASEEARS